MDTKYIFTHLIVLILGIIIGEPLKNLINGKYKIERIQKRKNEILKYLRKNSMSNSYKIANELYKNNINPEEIFNLLSELKNQGKVDIILTFDIKDELEAEWIYKF